MNFIKIKNLCYLTNTKRIKIQAIYWELTFTNYFSDRGLYPKYIRNSQNLIRKENLKLRKWTDYLNK